MVALEVPCHKSAGNFCETIDSKFTWGHFPCLLALPTSPSQVKVFLGLSGKGLRSIFRSQGCSWEY